MHKVFVYGSLLSGMGNHALLINSKKLGDAETPEGFGIVDLGWYPGAVKTDKPGKVIGEVYEVDDQTFARLDRLEGYNSHSPKDGLYNRISIDTTFGEAYIYIYNGWGNRMDNIITSGDWRTHYLNKNKK
jgi:gamma-glutamylcyclotransferase (GGCT)/AIG2-like uncharacterized protein YtfP